MEIKYEHKKAMTFIGFATTIKQNEGYTICPKFWNECYLNKFADLFQTMAPKNSLEDAIVENSIGTFAICDEKNNSFDYWIAGLFKGKEVPKELKLFTFPESDWVLFSSTGALPNSLQALNTYIWQKWYPSNQKWCVRNGSAMLEIYKQGNMQDPNYECEIWIPVNKNVK